MTLPETLQTILDDFALCEGREKLELLLQYAESLPALPQRFAADRASMEQVHECMSPVFVAAERTPSGGMHYYFDVPPEAPTVRGFAAILGEGLNGQTPQTILQIPNDFFLQMGLEKVLSNQRLNGISAILAHLKRLASSAL
ncbi:MAG: SufE family protein [Anaerolineales bacterium]